MHTADYATKNEQWKGSDGGFHLIKKAALLFSCVGLVRNSAFTYVASMCAKAEDYKESLSYQLRKLGLAGSLKSLDAIVHMQFQSLSYNPFTYVSCFCMVCVIARVHNYVLLVITCMCNVTCYRTYTSSFFYP